VLARIGPIRTRTIAVQVVRRRGKSGTLTASKICSMSSGISPFSSWAA
jgi:hypothetical protein